MPIVELKPEEALPSRTSYDVQLERDPTLLDVAKAQWDTSFIKRSTDYMTDAPNRDAAAGNTNYSYPIMDITGTFIQPVKNEPDDYDIRKDSRWKEPKYIQYADRSLEMESRYEANKFFAGIDATEENHATMASGSTFQNIAAGLAVGLADPINLIPIGGAAYKTFRTGEAIAGGVVRAGVSLGAATATEEVGMHYLDPTRTGGDSVAAVVGSTFIGGMMGGAAAGLSSKAFQELGKRTELEIKDIIASSVPRDTSVGAALAATTTLRDEGIKSITGLSDYFTPEMLAKPGAQGKLNRVLDKLFNPEKAFAFQDPVLRMANSVSKVARTSMEQLAELTLIKNKNTQGIASQISVENLIKGYEPLKYKYYTARDQAFLDYRNTKSKAMTRLGDATWNRSRADGLLTYQEFKEEISVATMNGGKHDIPEVAKAAQLKRDTVIQPIFEEAKRVGLIDADTPDAVDYLSRLWDHAAIKADRRGFENLNANWLKSKRDKAASDLEGMFKEFGLYENSRVWNAVKAEKDAFKSTKQSSKVAASDLADSAGKEKSLRLSINELETRLGDATKNQQRLYTKILNKRERGDAELSDLFNEFRSVSSAKKELYKRFALNEEKANVHSAEAIRRQAIADHLSEQERMLEEKLSKLEDQTKLMEDLEYRASFGDDDFSHISYQLTDRILGTSVGRLSYDNKIATGKAGSRGAKRGPAKARLYDIPNLMVKDFIIKDDDMLVESYIRSLAADIELTKKFASVDPEDALKKIQDDYEGLEFGVNDPATLEKLRQAKSADLRDFQAVWERLRGTFGNSGDDYASKWRSTERSLMNLNYVSRLGGMTISAFADVARPVMVHGLTRTYGEGLTSLFTNAKAFKAAAEDVKETGVALDMVLNTRARAAFGTDEFMPFQNKVEGITGAMAQNFSIISLMAPWNAAMKQFTGVITQNRMIKAINDIAAGKSIGAKETEYLAANFIDARMAKKIAAQFAEHGEKSGSVHVPNVRNWKDIEAAGAFRASVRKQVDQIIVTPGQDKPLWMSKSGWRLLGQFRSFSVASMQRTTLAGLQQRDMAVLNGTILSVALGGLTYVTKSQMSGREPDISLGNMAREGVDRSGVLAWLADANAVAEKVSRGRIGMSALAGKKPLSRYASRSALEAVLGPTYGLAGDAVQLTGSALSGDWQASDTHTLRRIAPWNNLPIISSIFDDAEKGINESLGVKNKGK